MKPLPHAKRICLCCLFTPEDRGVFIEFIERQMPPPPPGQLQ